MIAAIRSARPTAPIAATRSKGDEQLDAPVREVGPSVVGERNKDCGEGKRVREGSDGRGSKASGRQKRRDYHQEQKHRNERRDRRGVAEQPARAAPRLGPIVDSQVRGSWIIGRRFHKMLVGDLDRLDPRPEIREPAVAGDDADEMAHEAGQRIHPAG